MVGKAKKFSKVMALALASVFILASCSPGGDTDKKEGASKSDVKTIGILQTTQHPALDAANKGFVKALAEKGYKDGENVTIKQQNAQNETANNDQMAKKFVSDKVDLIFAIGTPSAQASYNSTKDIPIVISAVTAPVNAKLVKSMDKPETNVTGTCDLAPIKNQLEVVKKLNPSAKKVGFIYNAGEPNSVVQAKEAKKALDELGLGMVEQTLTSTNDAAQATDILASKVDAIYVPTDNTAVSAGAVIAQKALAKKIPVISAEGSLVEVGGLLSEGLDYIDLGYNAGLMAVDILEGKSKPQDMAIKLAEKYTLTVNKKTLDTLGIKLPEELQNKAQFVGGEK